MIIRRNVGSRHRLSGEPPAAIHTAKESASFLLGDSGRLEVRVHVSLGVVVGRNLVALAAFFFEPEPVDSSRSTRTNRLRGLAAQSEVGNGDRGSDQDIAGDDDRYSGSWDRSGD